MATFVQPAAAVVWEQGVAELSRYTPTRFWWWLFIASYLLMASGMGMTLRAAKKVT